MADELIAHPDDMVSITKFEYDDLLQSRKILLALHAGGVDNWEWYGDAMETVFGDEDS